MLLAYTALRLLHGHGARYHYEQAGKSISISTRFIWIESMLFAYTHIYRRCMLILTASYIFKRPLTAHCKCNMTASCIFPNLVLQYISRSRSHAAEHPVNTPVQTEESYHPQSSAKPQFGGHASRSITMAYPPSRNLGRTRSAARQTQPDEVMHTRLHALI
jgi:hypothetical protein